MKKILIIPLIVIISLVLTACTTKNTEQKGATGDERESTATDSNEEESINGSILDLAKLGKNVKCTYKFDNEETSMEGVAYVSGNKTRSDVKITMSDGTETESSNITDSEWMYMWSSESQQGTKMNLKEMEELTDEYQTEQNTEEETDYQYKDQTQKVDYKCKPWIVDNSKFDVPTNINFIDMNKMMEGFMEMGEEMQLGN